MATHDIEPSHPPHPDGHPREMLFVFLFFLVLNLLSAFFQNPINVGGGEGWDGALYSSMAQRFHVHIPIYDRPPFVTRIGTPFLASFFLGGQGPFFCYLAFLAVNLLANILSVWMLTVWLRFWVRDWKIRLLVSFLFQSNFLAPVRFVWFYSPLPDYWTLVFILGGLILIAQTRDLWKTSLQLSILAFIGIFFREMTALVPLYFLFFNFRFGSPLRSFFKKVHWKILPSLAALAGLFCVHQIVRVKQVDFFFWRDALWLIQTITLSQRLLIWFGAFGPLLLAVLLAPSKPLELFRKQPWLLAAFLGTSLVCNIAGAEERYFLFWLSPLVYVLMGMALESKDSILKFWPVMGFMLATQALSQRLFWSTPGQFSNANHVNPLILLAPFGDLNYGDTITFYEEPEVIRTRLCQYLLLGLCLGIAQAVYLYHRKNALRSGKPA